MHSNILECYSKGIILCFISEKTLLYFGKRYFFCNFAHVITFFVQLKE